ncbi:MAG: geranylgeranylglycerol-phosphate geranylgeranyltransferase [Candidatus Bathyarchaeia archaeon]
MGKLSGYVRLMRPINSLMMGFAVIVGAALASPGMLGASWQSLAYGFVTGFTLTAASMAINDYYDREIDAINEPKRPIPSGLIKPTNALIFALILTVLGFLAAALTNVLCFVTSIFAWIIFVVYTTFGKRTGLFGNFLVSTCVSIPFVYGSLAILNDVKLNSLIFVSMVFLANTGREITKGIVDVEGDKRQGVRTLAVRFGEGKAAVAASAFYLSSVAISLTPWFLGIVSFWFIPPVIITDIGLAASALMLLRDFSKENSKKIKNIILIWFFFGLLAFFAGVLGL